MLSRPGAKTDEQADHLSFTLAGRDGAAFKWRKGEVGGLSQGPHSKWGSEAFKPSPLLGLSGPWAKKL